MSPSSPLSDCPKLLDLLLSRLLFLPSLALPHFLVTLSFFRSLKYWTPPEVLEDNILKKVMEYFLLGEVRRRVKEQKVETFIDIDPTSIQDSKERKKKKDSEKINK